MNVCAFDLCVFVLEGFFTESDEEDDLKIAAKSRSQSPSPSSKSKFKFTILSVVN